MSFASSSSSTSKLRAVASQESASVAGPDPAQPDAAQMPPWVKRVRRLLEQAREHVHTTSFDEALRSVEQAQAELPVVQAKNRRARAADEQQQRADWAAEIAFVRLEAIFSRMTPDVFEATDEAMALAAAAGRRGLQADIWAIRAYRFARDDRIDEQLHSARQALDLAGPEDHTAHVWVHLSLAGTTHWLGEFRRAAEHYRPALQHARASGDKAMEALVLRHLMVTQAKEACSAWEAGQASASMLAQAEGGLRESLAFYDSSAPRRRVPFVWTWLAETLVMQQKMDEALEIYAQHLPALREMGLLLQAAEAGARLAQALLHLRRTDEAKAAIEQALAELADINDAGVKATVHGAHAQVLTAMGRRAHAQSAQAMAEQAHAQLAAYRDRFLEPVLRFLDELTSKPKPARGGAARERQN